MQVNKYIELPVVSYYLFVLYLYNFLGLVVENVVQLYMTNGKDEGSVLSGAEAFRKEFYLFSVIAVSTAHLYSSIYCIQ